MTTDPLAAPLTEDEERLVRAATASDAATFGTAVAILEVMPRVWATLDAARADGVTAPVQPAPDPLREALRDFVALLPGDRWHLLRPETVATVDAVLGEPR